MSHLIEDNSLPIDCRIRFSSEYGLLRRTGRRYHSQHFTVYVHCNSLSNSRLGITVSRKVGNAVVRNRLKRWLRELFRTQIRFILLNHDFSFVAKPGAGNLTHAQMNQELLGSFIQWKLGKCVAKTNHCIS